VTVRLGLGIDPDPLFAELIDAVGAAATELGIEPVPVRSQADARPVDRLLLVGRPGRFGPLLAIPGGPPTTVWTGEPLPPPPPGGRVVPLDRRGRARRRVLPPVGAALRRLSLPAVLDARRVEVATGRLLRANLDELARAAAGGACLVVTSRDRGATLAGFHLAASVVPFGYHERHAGPLTPSGMGPRDVPLLLLGSRAGHTRRAATVDGLRRSAAADLRIVDGVWGVERASLLRRTRVVIDVHRIPGNFVGLRLLLALAAGAAVVTEPMTDPWPFVPGVHHEEASATELLAVAADLAGDEPRRRRLVEAGQALLRDELTMRSSLAAVLAAGPSA
jgi:hypothetical protein